MQALVWLSNTDQIERFREVVRVAKGRSAAPVHYEGLDDLPYVAPLYGLLGLRFPTPYFAHGRLTVDPSGVGFASTAPRLLGNSVRNLRLDPWFIPAKALLSVEEYPLISPVDVRFDILFARLRSSEPGPTSDMLVASAASKLSPGRARQQSRLLCEAMAALCDSSGWASLQGAV